MATASPNEEGYKKDNYVLELNRVRDKIKTKFAELDDCLKARENQLLIDLDNILSAYLSFRTKLERVNEKKRGLEKTKLFLQNQLLTSPTNKPIHENIISQLDTEMKAIETPIEPRMVTFEFDSNKVLVGLTKLGKLVEKVRSGFDYKGKKQPLVSVCERGSGNQQLYFPLGVTIDDKTGNIYIADLSNHCVKVFDFSGKYLFKFGGNTGEGMMYLPRGVAIYGDRILITQSTNCIFYYQLNGMYISRIGRKGRGELEFNDPFGLTIDELNGDIYICDYNNNRVQILNRDFSFKAQFGKGGLIHPCDVKLSKEYIYVLDESNLCLHLFNYNYILQKSVITRGDGMDVVNPSFFFIDKTDNILISDCNSNSIHIYNTEFQLIRKISVSHYPAGITVDLKGRIIVVCKSTKDCLQIF